MLWIKAFHIIAMVAWFAGLFYLPRLFVYHAMSEDRTSIERFKVMERKLYFGIMTPSALITLALGLWLWLGYGIGRGAGWMHAKMLFVLFLVGWHIYLGKIMDRFARDENKRPHTFYRAINEVALIPLLGAVILVVVKPF